MDGENASLVNLVNRALDSIEKLKQEMDASDERCEKTDRLATISRNDLDEARQQLAIIQQLLYRGNGERSLLMRVTMLEMNVERDRQNAEKGIKRLFKIHEDEVITTRRAQAEADRQAKAARAKIVLAVVSGITSLIGLAITTIIPALLELLRK